MKNFKDLFAEELKSWLEWEEITQYQKEAIELIEKILLTRFNNEIKQYNKDEQKACDEFIAKRTLNILSYYVEELYFADKDVLSECHYAIRKEMRRILLVLRDVFNNNREVVEYNKIGSEN